MKPVFCKLLFASLFTIFSSLSFSQTIWGVYSGSTSEKDAVRFDVKEVRNAVSLQTGKGLQRMQRGFDYITNVTYKGGSVGNKAIPNAAQLPGAKAKLIALLKAAPFLPRMLVVENEENWKITNGSVSAYLAWFQTVADVARQFHIGITNGGITMPVTKALGYNYLLANGQITAAKEYKARNSINSSVLYSADWVMTEMDLLKARGFDTIPFNFHYQFADTKSITDFTTCLQAFIYYGFKRQMNNEVAMRTNDVILTVLATQACTALDYATWYNTTGEAGNARPLTDDQIAGFISVYKF